MDKIIFLDRDGVINKDPGGWSTNNYVTKPGEFIFLPGAIEAIRRLKSAGYTIYLISNQGGISKRYFTMKDLDDINRYMLERIRAGGGDIDGLYYCPHHDSDNCDCRKPEAGLFAQASRNARIDWNKTYFIGDSLRDVQAGKKMGLKTVFVLCGKKSREDSLKWPMQPDYIKKDLLETIEMILEEKNDTKK